MELEPMIPASWRELALPAPELETIAGFLDEEQAAGRGFQPGPERIFRALELTPPEQVRCVLVGQDPYPTPGVPVGLSFAVDPGAPLPASLRNIFREYSDDLGYPAPRSGDLIPWTQAGVLLLMAGEGVSGPGSVRSGLNPALRASSGPDGRVSARRVAA